MKKLIVILGCIMLGCFIFDSLLGNDATSFISQQKKIMQYELTQYSSIP